MRLISVDWNCMRRHVQTMAPYLWTVGLEGEREHVDPPLVGEIVELWDAESSLRVTAIVTVVRPAPYSTTEPPEPYIEFDIDSTSWREIVGTARCEHMTISGVVEASCGQCGWLRVRDANEAMLTR